MLAKSWAGREFDHYFGPFTYTFESRTKRFGFVLGSGDGDDYAGAYLRFHWSRHTFIIALPQAVLKPAKLWVDTSKYEWSTDPKGGYWDVHPNEYSAVITEGTLHIHYGRQTYDSSTDQNKCFFRPWFQWRFVRFSLYNPDGSLAHTFLQKDRPKGFSGFEVQRKAEEALPKVKFAFRDFDGEKIIASTHIEEREWLFGDKWCSWLSWFRKPKVRRSLSLEYASEVGKRKGSWKGGTIGCSIDMQPDESIASAWLRHCREEGLTPEVEQVQ